MLLYIITGHYSSPLFDYALGKTQQQFCQQINNRNSTDMRNLTMRQPENLILLLLQARIIMVHTILTSLTQYFSTDKWPSFKRASYQERQHEKYLIFVINTHSEAREKTPGATFYHLIGSCIY